MDFGKCSVIYLDKRVQNGGTTFKSSDVQKKSGKESDQGYLFEQEPSHVQSDLRAILTIFDEVFICDNGSASLHRLTQLDDNVTPAPTILLIDVPYDDDHAPNNDTLKHSGMRTAATNQVEKDEPQDIYGMHLLRHVCSCIQQRTLSHLVVPIAVVGSSAEMDEALQIEPSLHALSQCATSDAGRLVRYLDVGAADVLSHPLTQDRVRGLAAHAYRVYKDAVRDDSSALLVRRNRKLSWLGVDEQRPFAYLREVMVSGLMDGICNPESINDTIEASDLKVEDERKTLIENSVGQWNFSAHDFTSDELVFAAYTIFQHALQLPELKKWRLADDDLLVFIMASRRAYNDFVLYHNFRHVVDVLQAIFYFLLQIGLLPPYQVEGNPEAAPANAVAAVLKPFDAFTLLVAALGHDVGHPGVNNAFLVQLNAPLAQLYNDRSVLEAFHCAAYSQILRRYWPTAFADSSLRKLMITCILATDMSLHFKFINEMASLQETIAAAQSTADGWVPKVTDENRDLVCGLLIKCADISNVARKYACAAQWARVLTDEFSNQGAMEAELNMPTCLFGGPPDPMDFLKLAESQLGFMNIFARPLFEGVTTILPKMRFTLSELSANRAIWKERIESENSRKMSFVRGPLSPISRSTTTPSEVDSLDQRDRSFSTSGDDPLSVVRGGPGGRDGIPKTASIHNPQLETPTSLGPLHESDARTNSVGSTDSHVRGRSVSNSAASRLGDTLPKPGMRTDTQRRHSSVYSHGETGSGQSSKHVSRPNTSDRVHARAMTSEYQDAIKEIAAASRSPSPTKAGRTPQQQDVTGAAMLSTDSQTSSSNTLEHAGGRLTPSTKASSIDDVYAKPIQANPMPPPTTLTAHNNKSEEFQFMRHDPGSNNLPNGRKFQAMSVYGPDVLAMAAAQSPGKTSTLSQLTTGGSDDDLTTTSEERRDLRSMQSQSRLKGLRFWKKKTRSGEIEADQTP